MRTNRWANTYAMYTLPIIMLLLPMYEIGTEKGDRLIMHHGYAFYDTGSQLKGFFLIVRATHI